MEQSKRVSTVAIGCDHGGFDRKEHIIAYLRPLGYEVTDFGCYDKSGIDYPDVALPLAEAVAEGRFDRGILVCTTGIGVSICANKVKGIRCSLCCDTFTAEMTRRHNDANVLALGAQTVSDDSAEQIVAIWLNTRFEGDLPGSERHQRRVQKIIDFENR